MEAWDAHSSIRELASQQHGIVSRRQLRTCGVGSELIRNWAETRRLMKVFDGIYALGRPVDRKQAIWMASVLRGGQKAVLGGRSAAAAWRMLEPSNGVVVVRPSGKVLRLRGAGAHRRFYLDIRNASIQEGDITRQGPLPVMTPGRVLIDMARDLDRAGLRGAFLNAGRSGLLTRTCLEQCAIRGASFKGHARLMELIDLWQPGTGKLRSPMESEFLLLCGKYGIPAPRTNFRVGGYEVDCYWPGTRVIVELDSRTFHDDGFGFEDDREKGNALMNQGYTVLRFTHRMIRGDPAEVARTLRHHLGRSV